MENKTQYHDYIMRDVRRNLGLQKNDISMDAEIAEMTRKEVLDRYLNWNGIIGYTETFLEVVKDIYGVGLGEPTNQHGEFDHNLLHRVGKDIIESLGYIGDHEEDAATCYQAAKYIELLQWRIHTALETSSLDTIDSPQERMEMILRGDYDNKKEQALEGGIY